MPLRATAAGRPGGGLQDLKDVHEVLVKVGDEDVLLGGDDARELAVLLRAALARGEDLSRHGQGESSVLSSEPEPAAVVAVLGVQQSYRRACSSRPARLSSCSRRPRNSETTRPRPRATSAQASGASKGTAERSARAKAPSAARCTEMRLLSVCHLSPFSCLWLLWAQLH